MHSDSMRWFGPVLLLLVAPACTKATHINLEPKQPSLRSKSESIQMIGHVMTSHREDAEAHATWTIEDPNIASIDETGVLRAKSSGRTKAIAHYGDLVASVPVEIILVESVTSNMTKVELNREKGDYMKPEITVSSYDGLPLKDRAVEFSVKDPTICRVDKSGQFWPIEAGETVVTASVDHHSVDITCTVAAK